jgi:ribonuclease R
VLVGERSGRVIGLGMRARVVLREAVPVTGGLLFDLVSLEGKPAGASGDPRRKAGASRRPSFGARAGKGPSKGKPPRRKS